MKPLRDWYKDFCPFSLGHFEYKEITAFLTPRGVQRAYFFVRSLFFRLWKFSLWRPRNKKGICHQKYSYPHNPLTKLLRSMDKFYFPSDLALCPIMEFVLNREYQWYHLLFQRANLGANRYPPRKGTSCYTMLLLAQVNYDLPTEKKKSLTERPNDKTDTL